MMLEGVGAPSETRGIALGPPGGSDRLFVGATGDEYASLMQQADYPLDQFSLTGAGPQLPRQPHSYFYDWHGPSEVIDTPAPAR